MKKLFLDIETLPADLEDPAVVKDLEHLYEREVKISKQKGVEVISFEDFVVQTSFDGGFGRILCIAFAVNDENLKCYCSDEKGKWDEKKVLENFWKVAAQCDVLVGHNIFDFDMRFIFQRSVILGVKPLKNVNFARYRSDSMYDTKQEWTKWSFGGKSHLEYIALAMGVPSPKDGIDGSQVADFYKRGEVEKICDYCKRDVETTREVYKRMTFNG